MPANPGAVANQLADYVDYYRIRINPERSADVDKLIGLRFGPDQLFGLHIRGGLVDFLPELGSYPRKPDILIESSAANWAAIYNNLADPAALIDSGAMKMAAGDASEAKRLFALFDPIYDWKNDPALKALAVRQAKSK